MKFIYLAMLACIALPSASALAQEDPFSPLTPPPKTAPAKPQTPKQANPFAHPVAPSVTNKAINPFAQSANQRYDGEFSSDAIKLTLANFGTRLIGELTYLTNGQTYPLKASVNDATLTGTFTADGAAFSFSFSLNKAGSHGIFKTGDFQSNLKNINFTAPKPKQITPPIVEPIKVPTIAPPVPAPPVHSTVPEPKRPQPLHILQGHWDNIADVSFSADDKYAGSIADDGEVIIWNVAAGTRRYSRKGPGGVGSAIAFSPNNKYFYIGAYYNQSNKGYATRYTVEKGKKKDHLDLTGGILDINYKHDSNRVVVSWINKKIWPQIWNAKDMETKKYLKGHKDMVDTAMYSPDGRSILTNSLDGKIVVWNADNATMRFMITKGKEFSSYRAADYSPDGHYIVSVDTAIEIWDAHNGNKVRDLLPYPEQEADRTVFLDTYELIMSLAWHPNGKTIALGSSNGKIFILDAQSGEVKTILQGTHTGQIQTLSISNDGTKLISGEYGGGNKVVIWPYLD